MPVTLAQAKLNVQTDLDAYVIDEFRKSSFLLDNMPFHDAVSPTGGGATPTYGYTRLITQPTAAFRAINEEYTPSEVKKQRYTVDLKVFGGAFEVDRVISDMGGIVDEVQLQMEQKIKAAGALFNDKVINGNSATAAKEFDGLDVALTGSDTEFNKTTAIDLSTSATIDTNYKAFVDMMDEFMSLLNGTPSFIAGNTKLINKIKAIARRVGQYQMTQNDLGQTISTYGGIPLVDLGAKPGSNDPVVSINGSGETSLYAARFDLMDGFHGVSMNGQPIIRTWLPDFSTAGAVKRGEVEMVAAVALKATKGAAVFRKIKVQ